MRPSTLGGRVSHAANASAASAKLLEKRKEYEAVAALDRASQLYLERIEGLAEDCDIMAHAGEVHGMVLGQWPKMFNILNQFLAARTEAPEEPEQAPTEGQVLVRVSIEDLQQDSSH